MLDDECLRRRASSLRHKCVLLRQIHSNKMNRFQRSDAIVNVGTVIIAALVTFIGFFGLDKITKLISLVHPISNDVAELIFNLAIFLVLLFSILNISFQFKERSFRHWRAINLITDFVTDIDTILASKSFTESELDKHMLLLNSRYKHITDILPPSTDADYFKAKKVLAKKERLKSIRTVGATNENGYAPHN